MEHRRPSKMICMYIKGCCYLSRLVINTWDTFSLSSEMIWRNLIPLIQMNARKIPNDHISGNATIWEISCEGSSFVHNSDKVFSSWYANSSNSIDWLRAPDLQTGVTPSFVIKQSISTTKLSYHYGWPQTKLSSLRKETVSMSTCFQSRHQRL